MYQEIVSYINETICEEFAIFGDIKITAEGFFKLSYLLLA